MNLKEMSIITPCLGGAVFVVLFLLVRLLIVLSSLGKHPKQRTLHVKLLVIAGSGGHTTEMLRLVSSLSNNYSPRIYVLADSDKMSEDKIRTFEAEREQSDQKSWQYSLVRIPRSREVRQSYITSVASTIYATLYAFPLVFKQSPDLVLCNGPGTCIPICAAAFTLRLLGIKAVRQVFVESMCRVQTMSLSGKIMYYFADHLIVHWPSLKEKYPKSVYLGKIL